MTTIKSLIALTLAGAVAVVFSGCVTSGVACNPETPKVASIPAPTPEPQEKVVTRDVPGPERIVTVPGPERVVYSTVTVTQEVPGPERIVVKEVPVQQEPTKEK
jgi:hypothetical protein